MTNLNPAELDAIRARVNAYHEARRAVTPTSTASTKDRLIGNMQVIADFKALAPSDIAALLRHIDALETALREKR